MWAQTWVQIADELPRFFGHYNLIFFAKALGVTFALSVILFDLAVWAQHVVLHKVPTLWRLHRVHHSDTAFDVSTGVRFHPLEILLSTLYKAAMVLVLGAPAAAVIAFEVLLGATSLVTHGKRQIAARNGTERPSAARDA